MHSPYAGKPQRVVEVLEYAWYVLLSGIAEKVSKESCAISTGRLMVTSV